LIDASPTSVRLASLDHTLLLHTSHLHSSTDCTSAPPHLYIPGSCTPRAYTPALHYIYTPTHLCTPLLFILLPYISTPHYSTPPYHRTSIPPLLYTSALPRLYTSLLFTSSAQLSTPLRPTPRCEMGLSAGGTHFIMCTSTCAWLVPERWRWDDRCGVRIHIYGVNTAFAKSLRLHRTP